MRELDIFGYEKWRTNGMRTNVTLANEVVTNVPKTAEQVVAEMGVGDLDAIVSHLNHMVRDGRFRRDEEGKYTAVPHQNQRRPN